MASTHINHLRDYYGRVDRFPKRSNALSIGDSWFQYPLQLYPDLQTRLSSNKRFGERINVLDDSAPGRDAKDVPRMIRSWREIASVLASRGRPFELILLSLGGNDVIGKDFARHLTGGSGRDASAWAWSATVPAAARRWIGLGELAATFDRIVASYDLIVAMRDDFAPAATLIGHTYAAVMPINKPYKFFKVRAGPWIWKPASKLGIPQNDQQTIVDWLLESFNALLQSVAARAGGFVVLDTRRELTDPTGWDDEIHPLGEGFIHLADTFWTPAVEQALAQGSPDAQARSAGGGARGTTRLHDLWRIQRPGSGAKMGDCPLAVPEESSPSCLHAFPHFAR